MYKSKDIKVESTPRKRPKPILKWVGGKGQLLPDLLTRIPDGFGTYHEPFLGGGAVFFGLRAQNFTGPAVLSDINSELVGTYVAVRDDVEGVIRELKKHRYERDYYYAVRAQDPNTLSPAVRSARFIYLNKTGFNGLHRVNAKGQFNVPFGRYANPTICDEPNLRAASEALQGVELRVMDFRDVLDAAKPGDLVYFDPPYVPVKDASFTSYSRDGFNARDHIDLRGVFATLAGRGVYVVLSNSDAPLVRELYSGFNVGELMAARSVNCMGAGRGKVIEVIVVAGGPKDRPEGDE